MARAEGLRLRRAVRRGCFLRVEDLFDEALPAVDLPDAAAPGVVRGVEAGGIFLPLAVAGFFAEESDDACKARAGKGAKASQAARIAARRRAGTATGDGANLIIQL